LRDVLAVSPLQTVLNWKFFYIYWFLIAAITQQNQVVQAEVEKRQKYIEVYVDIKTISTLCHKYNIGF